MSQIKSDTPSTEPGTMCRNLRCNQMYFLSGAHLEEQLDNAVFWCSKTHEQFGPDGQPIGRHECCAGRTCYLG